MPIPKHITEFVRERFPKKEMSRNPSSPTGNPFKDQLVEETREVEERKKERETESTARGRDIRGGL